MVKNLLANKHPEEYYQHQSRYYYHASQSSLIKFRPCRYHSMGTLAYSWAQGLRNLNELT